MMNMTSGNLSVVRRIFKRQEKSKLSKDNKFGESMTCMLLNVFTKAKYKYNK